MNSYEIQRRKLARKKELNERLAKQRAEHLARTQANTWSFRVSQAAPTARDEPDSPSNHRDDNVPAPQQENFAPVARRLPENVAPPVVNVHANQAGNPYSPLTVSQVSWSPASSKVRAKRPADDSSDDESIDLVKQFEASQKHKKSDPPLQPSSTADHTNDDNISESVHEQKSPNNAIAMSTLEPALKPKPPRNPLTMSKMSHATQQQAFPSNHLANDDNLWSDIDDDNKESPKNSKPEKKQKPSKRKKNKRNEDPERDPSYNQPSTDTLDRLTEDEIANVDLSELKPVFDFPKFTAEPEEPFVLNAGNLGFESPVCVPASISRYLPPYQKEGIQFMYDQAVMSGHGAVLGDGEFCSVAQSCR